MLGRAAGATAIPHRCLQTVVEPSGNQPGVVGDDIAYFRNIDGEFRAVNVEQGIFDGDRFFLDFGQDLGRRADAAPQ